LGEYVERVVRRFVEQRTDDERFAQWVMRADETDLK
jgi:sulfite reductase (ferredoxin)